MRKRKLISLYFEAFLKIITLLFLLILFVGTFMPLIITSNLGSWSKVIVTLILNGLVGSLIIERMFSIVLEVKDI